MTSTDLTILKGVPAPAHSEPGTFLDFEEVRALVTSRLIFRHILRHRDVRLRVQRVGAFGKPWLSALLVRILSNRTASIEDIHGASERISIVRLMQLGAHLVADMKARPHLLSKVDADLVTLRQPRPATNLSRAASPVYLRSELSFGVQSGGSVGHIAGVVNSLDRVGLGSPILITTDPIPTVRQDLETQVILPSERFWDFRELPSFAYNGRLVDLTGRLLAERRPSFLYERYSVNSYAGLVLAREFGVPFVLEYNGSEVWIARNWGRPLRYEVRSQKIEDLLVRGADLVVVVSEPMRAELSNRGVEPNRILVNPNGVDTDQYAPSVDGSRVREKHGLANRTVVGFIGSFEPFHGAEVLADAFAMIVAANPAERDGIRLLMIGDGARLAATRERVETGGISRETVFAGRTPQADGPAHLAACDILVSPHVPNADGTPFFGSPTKLFEYMAMGRAIVASRLEQIGEVLVDGETALLVTPGDRMELAAAIARLGADPALRARLGAAARARAVEAHTWLAHTKRIVDAIEHLPARTDA